ncbi:MAG: RNB domain-containing ribonuclease, partial [Proteobacteria bacterium]
MKKGSRGGRSRDNSGGNSKGNQSSGGRGGSDSGRDSSRGSKESRSDSAKPGKRKGKDIKNARSLSDVLGGGRSGGAVGRDMNRGTSQGSRDRFEDRDDSSPNHSKGPTSTKLHYIMTFQPPEERNAQRDQRESYPVREPVRPNPVRAEVETGRPPERKQETRKPEPPQRKAPEIRDMRSQKSGNEPAPARESAWPKGRTTVAVQEDPSERTGKSGARLVKGMIKRHPDGFGFLIADDAETPDVYVARQSMTGIMTNDKVEVELYRPRSGKGKEERLSGEIVRVLHRANKRVVGRYLPVDKKYGILQDENKGWGTDLRIAADESMDAQDGQLVAVEITQYPDDEHEFTGRVVSIIGDVEDAVNDVIRVVHQSGIPTEFSAQAIADAQAFGGKVTDQERRGREDLTSLNLITIDGVTAKDFDDAVYTEQTSKGFKLIVAIADVSHYVKPGSRLDEDAYDRGTSTYFPNYVVPMLPEELSNELCSLKPHVTRLCFCCEMFLDFDGEVMSYRFFEGVMESKARVTYGEAQEV